MANKLKIDVFTCLLLFVLMQDANVLAKKLGRFKKLTARVEKLEENMEEQGNCKACSLIEQLTKRLSEVEKEIAEIKKPVTSEAPLPSTVPVVSTAPAPSTGPPPPTAPPTPAECATYSKLTKADRRVTFDSKLYMCDNRLGNFVAGWYRFEGAAGTKMPTTPPSMNKCGTNAPGWLNGEHPTVAEGKVTRQVCFNWDENSCNWKVDIEVRDCGAFYVYNLPETPQCNLRYCSTD